MKSACGLILGFALSGCGLTPAYAEHSAEDMIAHDKFYSDWMRPDYPDASCCNKNDCYVPDGVRIDERGKVWVIQRETGEWVFVPPQKIEHNRENPDGRNHVCMTPEGAVLCFIFGTGF